MRQDRIKSILILTVFIMSTITLHAHAATGVGKAIISIGKVFTTSKDGKEKKLKRRGKVFEGDTINVGKKSRLQLRFIDNQLVVLKENTVFRIDEYKFKDKNDNNKSAALSLLKGGMRSVTGLIGKSARDKYKVKTPVATMGVRGTHYLLQVCSGDCGDGVKGLVGTVLEGEIEMKNEGGTSTFGTDQFFNVPSSNEAPRAMTNPPSSLISRADVKQDKEDGDDNGNKKGKKGKRTIVRIAKLAPPKRIDSLRRKITTGPGSRLPPPRINPSLDPNATPIGFITPTTAPANAALVISGINASTGSPEGSGGIQDVNSTSIGIATVAGVSKQPVAANIVDPTKTVTYGVLSSGIAVGQGGDPLGVNWGRWLSTDVVAQIDGNDLKLLTGIAFIYSENLTSLTAISNLTSSTTYNTVAGPSVRDETGALVTGTLGLNIDFAASTISGLSGTLTGNGRTYNVDLDTPGSFPLSVFLAGDKVPIIAGCSGCPDMITALLGEAGGLFVGSGAEGFIGSFGLGGIGITGQTIGISGSRFFKATTPPM